MHPTLAMVEGFAALRGQPRVGIAVPGLRPRARVGADPTATLSATDIGAFDAKVNTLNADFIASNQGAAVATFAVKWANFVARWKLWFTDHGAGTGFFGGKAVDFFQNGAVSAQFNAFVFKLCARGAAVCRDQ